MLNRTMISLTAAIVLGSASAAFAYEAPENKIGDRYPFLEQAYQQSPASGSVGRIVAPMQIATLNQYANEAPEHKIGDRYPLLELAYRARPTMSAGRYLVERSMMSRQVTASSQYAYEAPENKIGDRYPFLEPRAVSQRVPTRLVTARRELTTGRIR